MLRFARKMAIAKVQNALSVIIRSRRVIRYACSDVIGYGYTITKFQQALLSNMNMYVCMYIEQTHTHADN